jgi:hypothetical protein
MRFGANFGLNHNSSEIRAVISVKTMLQKDRKFEDCFEHIECSILKGQT